MKLTTVVQRLPYCTILKFLCGPIEIGSTTVRCKNTIGTICNIRVDKSERGKGFGSKILRTTEDYLKQSNPGLTAIDLLAHQQQGDLLVEFYRKHNYSESVDDEPNRYDDGEVIYELIPMGKKV